MLSVKKRDGRVVPFNREKVYNAIKKAMNMSGKISETVAHKIGDAYDFKHDVAIVYTDSPFILSIFTDKEGYDKITSIADDVYGILK